MGLVIPFARRPAMAATAADAATIGVILAIGMPHVQHAGIPLVADWATTAHRLHSTNISGSAARCKERRCKRLQEISITGAFSLNFTATLSYTLHIDGGHDTPAQQPGR